MGSLVPQTSFASGELAPTLWSQFQQAAYAAGLRRCVNFFVSPHGAAVSRPGSLTVETINNLATGNTPVRLIPFRYSDDTAYVLAFIETAFGAGLHVVRDGAVVHTVVSPFHLVGGGLDLRKIKYAQVGATVYLTHPQITPQVLTFGGSDTAWGFEALDFTPPAPMGTYAAGFEAVLVDPPPKGTTNKEEHHWKLTQVLKYPSGMRLETSSVEVAKLWDGAVLGATYSAVDKYFELKPGDLTNTSTALAGDQAEIDFGYNGLNPPTGGVVIESWNVYRGSGDIFGLVWSAPYLYRDRFAGGNRFLDFGKEPDFTITPPRGTNPFKVYESQVSGTTVTNTLVRTEEPIACTFFGDRLWLGGTVERPFTLWASALSNYQDFDERFVPVPDMSIQYGLVVRSYQQIRSILGLGPMLIVLTDDGVHALVGTNGAAVDAKETPTTYVINEIGANWREPLLVANSLLYARARGGGVQALQFSAEGGGYQSEDLSFLTRHLFNGHEIVGWAHARVPWDLTLAVRDDGKLLALQYANGKTPGWTVWETNGTYEDVCVVPEGDEDAIYVTTKRGLRRFIERLSTRVIDDVADAVCVDNAATYEGTATKTPTGFGHLNGETVYGLADGFVVGPLTVSGGSVTLGKAASKVTLGLRYVPELETLDLAAGRNREKNVKRVFVDVEASRGLLAGEPKQDGTSPTDDELSSWRQRDASDAFLATPLASETVDIRLKGTWNRGARVILRQTDPLPLTVTGLTREVEAGGV